MYGSSLICYQSIGIVWAPAIYDECRFGHHLRRQARVLELSMTGTYKEYPYQEFHGYRARVLLLVL